MKKSTKTSALVLALLSVTAGLASCGETPATGPKNIEWWVPCGADTTGNIIFAYCNDMATAFNESQDDYIVNVVSKGSKGNDYGGTASAVSDALTGGNTPNMVTTYGTYVAAWRKASAEAVADVTDHGKTLEKDADFNQRYLDVERQQYGGEKYFSLPYSKSGEVYQYNVEAFKAVGSAPAGAVIENGYPAPAARAEKTAYEVPTTIKGIMELSRRIKADYPNIAWGRGEDKYYRAVPFIYESSMNLFVTALESAGIPFMDASKPLTQSVTWLDDARAKEVVKELKKWSNEGLFATANQLPMRNASNHEYPSTFIGKGNAFSMITSTANAPWDAADGYSIGFAKVQKWDDTAAFKSLSQGPSIAFFNHQDEGELKGALAFYDFLTSKENSARLALDTSYFPTRASSYETEGIKAAIENAKKTVTYETDYATKQSAYLGDVLNLNNEATSNNEYFMSPVNELSGKVRSAVSGMLSNLFNDVATIEDSATSDMVDAEFVKARNSIFA